MKQLRKRHFIIITTIIFLASFTLGYKSLKSMETSSSSAIMFYNDVKSLTFKDVLLNNIKSNALNIIGIFTLGILPIANVTFNGWFLGYYYSGAMRDLTLQQIIRSTAPHLMEIGVLLYTSGIILFYCYKIMLYLRNKIHVNDIVSIKIFFLELTICLLILFFSALVEMNFSIYQYR